MAKRVLILYATVGTGHKAAALALQEWFKLLEPQSEVQVRDVLEYVPRWVARCIAGSYLFMARKAPALWGWLYDRTDKPTGHSFIWDKIHGLLCAFYLKRLLKEVESLQPDLLVGTHVFALPPLVKKLDYRIPLYYVNTDFLTHALQRTPSFSGWYVGSDRAVDQYKAEGLAVGVASYGIPVAPVYSAPPDKASCCRHLVLDPKRPVVLLLGGGIGVGALESIADSFTSHPEIQLLVVCGTHRKMERRLREKYDPFRAHMRILGFIDYMPYCYGAADLVILKPGGLCSAEALAVGLPMLLMDPLPGQERYNADYLLEQGCALRLYENRKAGDYAEQLLKNQQLLQQLRERALFSGRPYAGRDIAADLIRHIEAPTTTAEMLPEHQTEKTSPEDCCEKSERA